MKKNSLLIIAFFYFSLHSFSQSEWVSAGINLAYISPKSSGTIDYKPVTSYRVGCLNSFTLNPTTDIETGISLNGRGFQTDEKEPSSTNLSITKQKARIYYLHVPLRLRFHAELIENKAFFFGAFGGYIGGGIFGKTVTSMSQNNQGFEEENSIQFGSDVDRFDYGLSLGVGVEFNLIRVGMNYNYGFKNINGTLLINNSTYRNNLIGLTLSFRN